MNDYLTSAWRQGLGWLETGLFSVGSTPVTTLGLLRVLLILALAWALSRLVRASLDRVAGRWTGMNRASLYALGRVLHYILLALGLVIGLATIGVDFTNLALLFGALGVGIGFGLQKIVSNFISGFILLGDRSIRPGDVITVGGTYGWVKELRARYIVVRNRDGVETLIPNENLVTTDVINWSFTDRQVRVRIPVQVSYGDDPEQAMEIVQNAARANARVLADPVPVVNLMEFADSGILLELRVWLSDPENGIGSVRSDINRAIWKGFKEAGITIPFPQRDVHLRYVDGPAHKTA